MALSVFPLIKLTEFFKGKIVLKITTKVAVYDARSVKWRKINLSKKFKPAQNANQFAG